MIARRRQNLSDLRLKTYAVVCVFFISEHSGVLVNTHGNIDRFRAIELSAQLEIKDTINEVKYGCV